MNTSDMLVIAELSSAGELAPGTLEALSAARRLADKLGGGLTVTLFGHTVEDQAQRLCHYGADSVVYVDDPLLVCYHPEAYLAVILPLYAEFQPRGIICGQSLNTLDLAPRLASRLKAGLITDCVAVDDERLRFTKPIYSGNVLGIYEVATTPFILTLRSRAFQAAPRQEKAAMLIRREGDLAPSLFQVEVLERRIEPEGLSLGAADRIVAGGRGMGGPQGFAQLTELAGVLQAAVGASRPPCDLEWVGSQYQVGQTGEIVAPHLYVAVGISGSTQHIAGMAGSKTIVAINKDKDANIFKMADYGVVGTYEEVIPAFIAGLKELL